MKYPKYLLLLLLCLLLTACGPKPAEAVTLDLDYIADTLTASGYFPEPLEAQDPELVPGLLNLYEDRIEANPEDIAQAVALFADERSSFLTGQVLTADGGFIL